MTGPLFQSLLHSTYLCSDLLSLVKRGGLTKQAIHTRFLQRGYAFFLFALNLVHLPLDLSNLARTVLQLPFMACQLTFAILFFAEDDQVDDNVSKLLLDGTVGGIFCQYPANFSLVPVMAFSNAALQSIFPDRSLGLRV